MNKHKISLISILRSLITWETEYTQGTDCRSWQGSSIQFPLPSTAVPLMVHHVLEVEKKCKKAVSVNDDLNGHCLPLCLPVRTFLFSSIQIGFILLMYACSSFSFREILRYRAAPYQIPVKRKPHRQNC